MKISYLLERILGNLGFGFNKHFLFINASVGKHREQCTFIVGHARLACGRAEEIKFVCNFEIILYFGAHCLNKEL